MKNSYLTISIGALMNILLMLSTNVNAQADGTEQTAQDNLLSIQQQWEKVNYQLSGKEQDKAYQALLLSITELSESNTKNAEFAIWQGIIQSSYAGAKGGLGALSYAKKAKKSLEHALSLDPNALAGSAYTSLGTLYHKVPGWPVAFGDDDTAKTMLEKALTINPDGIDPNYFYGEFLFDEREYKQAKLSLEKALAAPSRANRELADESRRAEVLALMQKVDAKLKAKS
jgi:tetratricopeptide (TPR) repeat protein